MFYFIFFIICLAYIFYTLFVAKNITNIHDNVTIKKILHATNFLILIIFFTVYFIPDDFRLFDFSMITFLVVIINTLFTLLTKDNLFESEILMRYAITSFFVASFIIPSFYVFKVKVLYFYLIGVVVYMWVYYVEKHLKDLVKKFNR